MALSEVVSRGQWLQARVRLLGQGERTLAPRRDALDAARRRLPQIGIETDYAFASADGSVLSDSANPSGYR